jgi:hypothetical protein
VQAGTDANVPLGLSRAGVDATAFERPAFRAVGILLALAALGSLAVALSLVPSRFYLRASSAIPSRMFADFAYRLASSRGDVGLLGLATLTVLGFAFLLLRV